MLEDLIDDRLEKLKAYREQFNPYPSDIQRDHSIGKIKSSFSDFEEKDDDLNVVGRVMAVRDQGKIIFSDIKDGTDEIQIVLREGHTENFDLIQDTLDKGDFVHVKGKAHTTKTGEESIDVSTTEIISKSIRPWPSSWFGLEDDEKRQRRRYMDFVFNEESKEKIKKRSEITSNLRNILEDDDFMEVETPILQPVPGGALAQPFETHFNALDLDVYLRVAPELYLKRLLVGGFEKIFEIGKDFRNEGIDRDHYPEFTMLELYWAYEDYHGMMDAVERWLKELAKSVGIEEVTIDGEEIDFFDDWPRVEYKELIEKYAPEDIDKLNTPEIDDIFKKKVRPNLKDPMFMINHPKAISPLAKSTEGNEETTERFQLLVAGTELANGFSELNDPQDQRKRMEEQEERHREGDEEASRMDEDFLEALEYGMPPAAGLGIGIDRLVALLTDTHNIRDIITFTNIKPKEDNA